MAKMTNLRLKKCPSCQGFVPTGSMIQGECPDCAGLVAPPLRTADGRFMPVRQVGTRTRR